MLKSFLAFALIAVGSSTMGQLTGATLDILDGADAGAPSPTGVIIIDGFVSVASTDVWTAAGIRCVTSNGATLVYDPNGATNPGLDGVFATSVSNPKILRTANARFINSTATVAGGYTGGPAPGFLTPTEFNVAWFDNRPPSQASPAVNGYVLRLAIATTYSVDEVILGGLTAPAGYGVLLASIETPLHGTAGWANATLDAPDPVGGNSYLWAVPEPSSVALLALGALGCRRREPRVDIWASGPGISSTAAPIA